MMAWSELFRLRLIMSRLTSDATGFAGGLAGHGVWRLVRGPKGLLQIG
jgi:hypothetical protein